MGFPAARVFFCVLRLRTMVKPAKLTVISSTVCFGNGKYSFTVPPFPAATAHEWHQGNAFNYWEQETIGQMIKGVHVHKLMGISAVPVTVAVAVAVEVGDADVDADADADEDIGRPSGLSNQTPSSAVSVGVQSKFHLFDCWISEGVVCGSAIGSGSWFCLNANCGIAAHKKISNKVLIVGCVSVRQNDDTAYVGPHIVDVKIEDSFMGEWLVNELMLPDWVVRMGDVSRFEGKTTTNDSLVRSLYFNFKTQSHSRYCEGHHYLRHPVLSSAGKK
jgi:hypothetical protein